MADSPGKPGHHMVEVRAIKCPYCFIGTAEFEMKIYKSAFVGNFEEPRRCSACNQWVRCKPKVILEGVKVDV